MDATDTAGKYRSAFVLVTTCFSLGHRPQSERHSYRDFVWAVIGQFFYGGAQIGSRSYFIDFTRELSPQTAERAGAFMLSVA
jgi:fucose permease